MMIGTLCFIHSLMSASNLGLVGCTMRFTPNGAAFLPLSVSNLSNADFIWISHSSKPSLVRWFNAGKVPTIPFLQHSMTRSGPEIKNMGAAMTGRERSPIKDGFLLMYRELIDFKNRDKFLGMLCFVFQNYGIFAIAMHA